MCADVGDYSKIGTNRSNVKVKQENRKRMGKKVVVSGLRTSDNDDEMYAVVTRFFGNGMCEVKCADGVMRMCIIRKKFRGRVKQSNQVSVGATVMVGVRSWEKNERSSMQKCDLLEIYNDSELRKLKQRSAISGLDKITQGLENIIVNDVEFEAKGRGDDRDGIKGRGGRDGDENGDGDGDDDGEVSAQPNRDYDLLNASEDEDNDNNNDNDNSANYVKKSVKHFNSDLYSDDDEYDNINVDEI